MIYNPGELNKRVEIISSIPDNSGDFDRAADKTVCTCWASIAPLRGREYYDAGAKRDDGQVKITIRYRTGIDATCRVKYGNHLYALNCPPVDPFMDHASLELYCTETTRGVSPAKKEGGWET